MAFVGLIVGAGFASGQEVMQYFVAFGTWGIWGAILSCVIMTISGLAVLQLGSYFQAREHNLVFTRVSNRGVALFLDGAVMLTLFLTGMVMMAGAGSNLNQQFELPIWVGATLMLVLVLAVGMLDVKKVTAIIGAITPFIIVFLLIASVYAASQMQGSLGEAATYAHDHVSTTLPNWGVSALNYVGFNLMVAVSMAIIIGGEQFSPREAGVGGMLGGLIFGLLLLISTLALLSSAQVVSEYDLPVLSLINQIHPVLGTVMAVVIYGMIFNTGIGMFYALAKRLTASNPAKFRMVFIPITLVGFVLSFFGFRSLVSYVYPFLGYVGVVLIVVVSVAWLRGRRRISAETQRRRRLLISNQQEDLDASNLDNETLQRKVDELNSRD